jgi:ABC-2 type transport system permease protein
MISLERIREIVRKEFRQALREPRMRAVLFVPPILQLIVFGYAVNLDVENASMAWMDQDRTPQSRELLARFQGSGRFEVRAVPANETEAGRLLDRNDVQLVVGVLPGFARDLERGQTAGVQILVDGTNSNTASLVSSYAGQIVAAFSAEELAARQKTRVLARGAAGPVNLATPSLNARTRVWFNPDLRSRNYFVPGVMVNIIMLVTLMLTALAIVREKEIGTMEQLMVTPVRPIELMIGKTLPFAVVGFLDMLLVTGVALLVFRIPFRGSPLLLLVAAVPYLLTTLGAGLFLSTTSQTQQQAMMSSTFFSMPAFMLSGFAFPIRNMPEVVQYLTYLNPLRYFMEIVRGIFLKGAGFSVLWPQILALTVYGVAVVLLSAARFHKRLD